MLVQLLLTKMPSPRLRRGIWNVPWVRAASVAAFFALRLSEAAKDCLLGSLRKMLGRGTWNRRSGRVDLVHSESISRQRRSYVLGADVTHPLQSDHTSCTNIELGKSDPVRPDHVHNHSRTLSSTLRRLVKPRDADNSVHKRWSLLPSKLNALTDGRRGSGR